MQPYSALGDVLTPSCQPTIITQCQCQYAITHVRPYARTV